MSPIEFVLYTRQPCRLCDLMKASMEKFSSREGRAIVVREVNVDEDPVVLARYGEDVPVVELRGREVMRHRFDAEAFRAALAEEHAAASGLAAMQCVPCRGGVPPMPLDIAESWLARLGGSWRIEEGHHLRKEYTFPDFASALAFVNRIGAVAEEQGHHPDVELGWGKVGVTIYTHKIDGLTESDFVLAAKIEQMV